MINNEKIISSFENSLDEMSPAERTKFLKELGFDVAPRVTTVRVKAPKTYVVRAKAAKAAE